MSETLPEAAARVRDELRRLGHEGAVQVMPDSTRTAAEAAVALGCEVAHIAKSLIFRTIDSDRPVLVVASGVNRVDEGKLATLLGEKVGRADADFVRARTGFAIGGVPPVGHATPPIVLIDRDLMEYPGIWAAAGTPRAVFPLTPEALVRLTDGAVADIASR